MCSEIHSGRGVEVGSGRIFEESAARLQQERSAHNFSTGGADASATADVVKRSGAISREPASSGVLSCGNLVETAESQRAKTVQAADGLWRCEGLSAVPRSRCRIFGNSSRGAMRCVAGFGYHRLAAG